MKNLFGKGRKKGNQPKTRRLKKGAKREYDHKVHTPKELKQTVQTPAFGQHSDDDENQTEQEINAPDRIIGGRYKPDNRIMGKGAYGTVEQVIAQYDNTHGVIRGGHYALKTIKRGFKTQTDSLRLLREIRILRILSESQLIVDLVDILPPDEPATFTEISLLFGFMEADLKNIFESHQFFSSLHCEYIMYQIIQGIHYFHSANIVHRDLKPANILINADCMIKICDFGLARSVVEDINQLDSKDPSDNKNKRKLKKAPVKRGVTKHVVTRWYRAPEIILLQQNRAKIFAVDVWSAGCIFAELMQMIKGMCKTDDRDPIFPGSSCFPFSPVNGFNWDEHGRDQLVLIFKQLGCPSQAEISKFKKDNNAVKYLKAISQGIADLKVQQALDQNLDPNDPNVDTDPTKPLYDLKMRYPIYKKIEDKKGSQAIDLLSKMLAFDVDNRVNTSEILKHPYFTRVRDEDSEQTIETAPRFDFEDKKLTSDALRELICHEIAFYNDEWRLKHFPNLSFEDNYTEETKDDNPDDTTNNNNSNDNNSNDNNINNNSKKKTNTANDDSKDNSNNQDSTQTNGNATNKPKNNNNNNNSNAT